MYYLLSLKHTNSSDGFITMWGPNRCGYQYNKSQIGRYDDVSWVDRLTTFPVLCSEVDDLFITSKDGDEEIEVLPNVDKVLSQIDLVRAKYHGKRGVMPSVKEIQKAINKT